MTQKHFSAKVILSIIAALLIICTLSTVTLAANQVANYGCAYGQAVPTNDKLSAKVSQYNFYGDEGTLYFMQISKGKADAHYAVEIFSDKSLSPNTKIRSFTKEFSKTAGNVPLKITWDFKTTVSGTYYGRCYTYVETTKDGQITKTVDTSSFSTFQININRVGTKTVKLKSLVNTEYGPKITWEALPTGTKYNVYRKSTVKGEESWKLVKHLSYATTSFVDETAKSGVNYTYTVKGADIKYQSKYDTKGLTLKYLSMPKVTVTGVGVNGTAFLKWNEVPGAQGYYVYRKGGNLNNSGWKLITTIKNGKTVSYTDTAATSTDWHYTYTVKAYNGKTVSAYNQKGVDYDHIKAPTIKRVYSYDGGMRIEWANANENVKGYYVYRLNGKSWTYVGQTTQKYLIDSKAESLKSYTYTVKAFSKNNNGGYNNKGVTAKYIAAPTFTDKNNAVYKVTFDDKYVGTVTWNAVEGASGYIVYRKVNNAAKWTDIADIKDGKTTVFKDESKKVGGYTYQYTVRAYDSKGIFSGFSATGTKGVCLAMPVVKLAQIEREDNSLAVEVSWGKIAGATRYNVYRKSNVPGEGSWKRIALVSTTDYVDTTISAGKKYEYTVRALNNTGDQSAYRTPVPTITPVRIPVIKDVIANHLDQTIITWDALKGATGYNVYRMAKDGHEWEKLSTETANQYTDNSEGAGTKSYYYAVTTLLNTAESAKSTPVANFVELSIKATAVEDGISLNVKCDRLDTILITRAEGESTPKQVFNTLTDGYVYLDTEAEKGKTYTYVVKGGLAGKVDGVASIEVERPHDPLDPTYFTEYENILAADQNLTVKLSWVKVPYAEKYVVLRSEDNNIWNEVATVDTFADKATITYLDHPESGDKTYWYKVKATAPEANRPESESSSVSVEVLLPLEPVMNIKTSSSNSHIVDISWLGVKNAEKYDIYRTTTPDNEDSWELTDLTYAEEVKNAGTDNEIKTGNYIATDNTLPRNGTYFYKVVASSEKRGTSMGKTTDGIVVTQVPLKSATNLQIKDATTTAYAIKLTWSVVEDAEVYVVSRSTDGTTWTDVETCTDTTYTDTNVVPNLEYSYRIKAMAPEAGIKSSVSDIIKYTLTKRLLPFSKTEATVDEDNKTVIISWSPVDGAEKYEVYRTCTPNLESSWTKLETHSNVNENGMHFATDATITENGTYYYRIVAVSERYGSIIGNVAEGISITVFPLDATTITKIEDATDKDYAISLDWTAVKHAEKYVVLRSADEGATWTEIATCTEVSYIDTDVEPNVKYIYKIKATAPVAGSPESESAVKDITLNKRLLPFDKAEAILGTDNKVVTIGWSGVEGAEKYQVFRSSTPDDANSWATIGIVKVTIPQTSEINHEYTDITIEADGTYTYKVVAYSEELGEIFAITDAVEVTGFAEDVTPEEPVTPPVDPENPPVDPENPGENEGGTDTPTDPVDPENPPVNPETPGENEGGTDTPTDPVDPPVNPGEPEDDDEGGIGEI